MKRADLEELEKAVMDEVVTRRRLGGYNSEAATILIWGEALLKIIAHLKDQAPRPKK